MLYDYTIHDKKYIEARARGWQGWGGDQRMALEHIWIERLFSYADVPTGGRVLELGCGEGHYARLLAQRGYEVVGVDVLPTAIQWAEEKTRGTGYAITFQVYDLAQPDVLLGQYFDLVVDGNCLHCIIGEDRLVFLANVRRLLKDAGVFFVSSLCSNTADDKVVEFEGKPYRHIPGELSLLRELEMAGFVVKQSVVHQGDKNNHCTVHLTKR